MFYFKSISTFPGNKTCLPSYTASRLHHLRQLEMIQWHHHSLQQSCRKCSLGWYHQVALNTGGQSHCTRFRLLFCGSRAVPLTSTLGGTHKTGIKADPAQQISSNSASFVWKNGMQATAYNRIMKIYEQPFPAEDVIHYQFDDLNWSTAHCIFILHFWTCVFRLRKIFT